MWAFYYGSVLSLVLHLFVFASSVDKRPGEMLADVWLFGMEQEYAQERRELLTLYQSGKFIGPGSSSNVYGKFVGATVIYGNLLLVGYYGDGNYLGVAYLYVLSNGAWSQTQQLRNGVGSSYFGRSAAFVSSSTFVVGAPYEDYSVGAVYVFMQSGNAFSQSQRLSLSSTSASQLGASLSATSSTIVVGAPVDGKKVRA